MTNARAAAAFDADTCLPREALAKWGDTLVMNAAPTPAAAMAARPPIARPHRAPICSPTHPMIGAPMGVDPKKAMVHKDITLPRICGTASSCRIVFAIDVKLIENTPTTIISIVAVARVGIKETASRLMPKSSADIVRRPIDAFPLLAENNPPKTAPRLMATVKSA